MSAVEDRHTVAVARPRYLPGRRHPTARDEAGDSPKGALLIHGFASYAGIMDPLAARLNERGFTVSVPRLPGHGTDAHDFIKVRWKEWLRCVYDAYFDLRGICSEVHVSGLSLGGILALCIAADYTPERIALLAPAIVNTDKGIYLTPVLRYLIGSISSTYEAQGQDMENPDIQYLAEEYWSRRWLGPSSQVLATQLYARRRLGRIAADSLIVLSRSDTTVPLAAGELIERSIKSETRRTVVLDESKHNLLSHVEKERVVNEVVNWFCA